jgi:predicted acyl esterase
MIRPIQVSDGGTVSANVFRPAMHWETVDPEWWVPQGYAVVRYDTRGTGKPPGRAHALARPRPRTLLPVIPGE